MEILLWIYAIGVLVAFVLTLIRHKFVISEFQRKDRPLEIIDPVMCIGSWFWAGVMLWDIIIDNYYDSKHF